MAELKAEDGWLSVVGLHWLHQGETRLGSDPSCDVLLPAGAPAFVGTLVLQEDRAFFRAEPASKLTRGGSAFTQGAIRSDAGGKPDVLAIGDIRLILLKRGSRYAPRVKDNQSAARTRFSDLKWYPIDEDWKISARFVPAPEHTRLVFDTIVGEQEMTDSPGYAVFERAGKTYRLQAARIRRVSVVRFPRRDERPDDPWRSSPTLGCSPARRRRAPRFQQGNQSAVRLYPVRNMPARSAT